jgi:hypothetical protein
MYLKVIACEIAVREICQAISRSSNVVDVEFLAQGLHDQPALGRTKVQERVDAVEEGKYDAILLGYALCGNILNGLAARHTPLVLPKAHDCITFFLGTKERYQQLNQDVAGAYYYTSGWIECARRRGNKAPFGSQQFLPTRAGMLNTHQDTYHQWVEKYGEDSARHLLEVMDRWTESYTHGILIDFDFTKPLHLREQVQHICEKRGWHFEEVEGDLRLLQHWVDGEWDPRQFLQVPPGHRVVPSYDEDVVRSEPAPAGA